LDNVEDAEFVVAKAMKDGGIHATIDHAGQFLKSQDSSDVYSTQEPQLAFHRRVEFCLKTHNEAVKAMRFPPNQNKFQLENADERREREQEIAENLADDEDDFM
jgi:26S proteasome regulatory subunit N3